MILLNLFPRAAKEATTIGNEEDREGKPHIRPMVRQNALFPFLIIPDQDNFPNKLAGISNIGWDFTSNGKITTLQNSNKTGTGYAIPKFVSEARYYLNSGIA
jgi:hypothetical protein